MKSRVLVIEIRIEYGDSWVPNCHQYKYTDQSTIVFQGRRQASVGVASLTGLLPSPRAWATDPWAGAGPEARHDLV